MSCSASFICVFELQMMCLHVLFKCCEPTDFPTPHDGSMLLCSVDLKESYWKLLVNSPVFDLQFNQSEEQSIKTVLKLSVFILHRLSVSQGTLHNLTSLLRRYWSFPAPRVTNSPPSITVSSSFFLIGPEHK